jgi:uncharacterized protein YegJ (DUF2314 family)
MPARRFSISLISLSLALPACDQSPSSNRDAELPHQGSAWVRDSVSAHVVLSQQAIEELSTSIEEAQRTAEAAREQFASALPHERLRFVVLWMAPTMEGSREFVWVRPLSWSPFRIEGELQSEPTMPLESSGTRGAVVSFPIEELADWVIFDPDRPGYAVKGAVTIQAIEQRLGAPPTM